MNVLQINCVYGQGSTGKLTRALHHALQARGDRSTVVYGRGAGSDEAGAVRLTPELYGKLNKAIACADGLMYGGCRIATDRLFRRLREDRPDLVHLHSVNGNFVNLYRLLAFLKDEGIPTVITHHAEFFYTANCAHAFDCDRWQTGCGCCPDYKTRTHAWFKDATARSWQKMDRAFRGFSGLVSVCVSPWQAERVRRSPFFRDKRVETILNGVDTTVFRPEAAAELPDRCRRGDERLFLYVTPEFDLSEGHLKGGAYVLALAKALAQYPARIVVVGSADQTPMPENVQLYGRVEDQRELAALYAGADATILTSKRETFSMICAESLCCGTPVAGFLAGGPETIALPAYSRFCRYGDVEALKRALLEACGLGPRSVVAGAAKQAYDETDMTDRYLRLYDEMTSERKREG